MIELRDYQRDLLECVKDALADPSARIMMQLPTGSGKTRIAGELLSGWLKHGRKAVWLTHRRELAFQTEGMIQEAGVGATANIRWTPHTKAPTLVNGVVILMAQTVGRRTNEANVWDHYNSGDLMIIDEAHHATADGYARAIRQWPGPILGMTATPWRLSEKEGFEHLFEKLYCGPQVAALQSDKWLCLARMLSPPEEEQIRGGQVDYTGDYSESGIVQANQDRDIWTAGALGFWQEHGEERQTLVYAVSVRHAHNLVHVFLDAGISAGALLGDTPAGIRADLIERFQNGTLKVLVNVVVVTEGFDLPDAACVVLTRPTMSLSLYLQMVGRGLRPKQDDGDCVILDLAGNGLRHGLPEEDREWSLMPRGTQPPGEAPSVWCPQCEGLSLAASHQCVHCRAPFGEDCDRCGQWRAWIRWSRKTMCGQAHDIVCDLCHYDAHIQAHLPVTEELMGLAKLADDDEPLSHQDHFLRNFLKEELRRFTDGNAEKQTALRLSISQRESDLHDDDGMYHKFEQHLNSLPYEQRPANERQKALMYGEWENGYKGEFDGWKEELVALESQPIDGQLIFNNARDRLMRLFEAEAIEAGLLPRKQIPGIPLQTPVENDSSHVSIDPGGWMTLVQLAKWGQDVSRRASIKPELLQYPSGVEGVIRGWDDLLLETAEWLIREGSLTKDVCPVTLDEVTRYLIHVEPIHSTKDRFWSEVRLSNGLYLERIFDVKTMVRHCGLLLEKFGHDPAQFSVWLRW